MIHFFPPPPPLSLWIIYSEGTGRAWIKKNTLKLVCSTSYSSPHLEGKRPHGSQVGAWKNNMIRESENLQRSKSLNQCWQDFTRPRKTNSSRSFLLVVTTKCPALPYLRALCPSLFWDSLSPNHLVNFFQFWAQISPPTEKTIWPKINPPPLFCAPKQSPNIHKCRNSLLPCSPISVASVISETHSSWTRVHNYLLNTQMKAEQDETKKMPVYLIISK